VKQASAQADVLISTVDGTCVFCVMRNERGVPSTPDCKVFISDNFNALRNQRPLCLERGILLWMLRACYTLNGTLQRL
jgi:hypothetical protein